MSNSQNTHDTVEERHQVDSVMWDRILRHRVVALEVLVLQQVLVVAWKDEEASWRKNYYKMDRAVALEDCRLEGVSVE